MDFEDDQQQGDVEEIQDLEEDIFGGAEEGGVQDQVSRKDAVLFLVDCRPQTFQRIKEDKETQFQKVMKAFQSFLKSKIISSVDDKIGLMLYNVRKGQNPLNFKGIHLLYPLEVPSAERIRECVELERSFTQEFGGSASDAHLYECLWLCNHELKSLDKNRFSMRIFLFTPEDQPLFKDHNAREQTIKHAKQLKDIDVGIELFPLYKNDGHVFDVHRFYSEIIVIDMDELNNAVVDATQKIMDLQQRVRQKEFRKRALNRLLMDIGPDTQVGLKIYCLLSEAKKPIGKPVERKTNSILKKKTQAVCVDTGNPLFPNQIGTYFPLGNEKVPLSKEQMSQIKSFQKPGMTLCGFKPLQQLKDFHNYRTSYFVYPDDEHVNGSSQFFDALIRQMIEKKKMAIAKLVPRQGSTIRFCALIPQQEAYDDDHFQRPPGLHMIFLPYADDLRGLETAKKQGNEVSRELLNITKIMVNALTLNDFDCANFEDPSIQKFFAHLQGHALHEQNIEDPPDLLEPDYQGMEKYRDIINLFQQAIELECVDGGGSKRGRGGAGRGRGRAKQQIDEEDDDVKVEQPKRGSGRGRGRGRGKQQMHDDDDDEPNSEDIKFIDDDDEDAPKPSKRGRGRGRAKK